MESMSEIVNQMLDITKNMSKSIARMEARMQNSWDQMIEVLDKQSNVILEIKEQSKVQGSHESLTIDTLRKKRYGLWIGVLCASVMVN